MRLRQNRLLCLLLITPALLLNACFGLFDSYRHWEDPPYILVWIDKPESVTLNYIIESTSSLRVIDEQVFAVGSNKHYVVAQQHPDGNKTITNYFILDKSKGARAAHQDAGSVIGPLSEKDYLAKKQILNLPEFTKILDYIK